MTLPVTIQTDYTAIDIHIAKVVVFDIFEDNQYIMCDLYDDNDNVVCHGACYWYAGPNKNIPFDFQP